MLRKKEPLRRAAEIYVHQKDTTEKGVLQVSDILNRDYPAKKRGRPKKAISAEEGARQIMDLLQGAPPIRQTVRQRRLSVCRISRE